MDSLSLALQPLNAQDAAQVFKVWGDFEATKFTNWTFTPTEADCAARLDRVLQYYAKDSQNFGPYMIRTEAGRFIGLIGADHSSAETGQYEVWYILVRAEWGRGFATQALEKLLGSMIAANRVSKAVATAVCSNPASVRVLEKNGFRKDSIEAGGYVREGLTFDLAHFSREI